MLRLFRFVGARGRNAARAAVASTQDACNYKRFSSTFRAVAKLPVTSQDVTHSYVWISGRTYCGILHFFLFLGPPIYDGIVYYHLLFREVRQGMSYGEALIMLLSPLRSCLEFFTATDDGSTAS